MKNTEESRIERIIENQRSANYGRHPLRGFGLLGFSDITGSTSHQPYQFFPYRHFININSEMAFHSRGGKYNPEADKQQSEAIIRFLKPGIKGKRLIDLGCGEFGSVNVVGEFAKKLEASEYVGVDYYCDQCESERDIQGVKTIIKGRGGNTKINVDIVKEDMLRYLFKQPQESANIVLNGIDYSIIDDEEYIDELRDKISKVVPRNGFAMGYNSPHLNGLENLGFERISEIPGYGTLSKSNSEVANKGEFLYKKSK